MKVGLVIICYNISSEIFLLQMEAIRKFCKDKDYTIEIIDNSSDEEMAEGIRYHSESVNMKGELRINYTRTHSSTKDSSDSHCFASNFSYRILKEDYSLFGYLDHDLIPITDFSVEEILGETKMIAGVGQHHGVYMWPGCLFFRKMEGIDFSPNHDLGYDTGGNLYKTIENVGKEHCIFFNEQYFENPYYRKEPYNYYAVINNGMFLHCVALSNWVNLEDHTDRVNSIINIIREKIHDEKNRNDVHNFVEGEINYEADTTD